jgi:pimeloyl-ACP methyl ester carboxylesterase
MRNFTRWTLAIVAGVAVLALVLLVAFRVSAGWRETGPDEPPVEGRMVKLDDGDVFVQVMGPETGLPVMLVHGTAAWSGFWSDVADALAARGFRVVAIDVPPFGYSSRSAAGAYSRSDQARRLRDVARALNLNAPMIVGHSFGAGAVAEAVMRDPRDFGGMVLICGALGLPESGNDYPADNALLRALIGRPLVAETLVAATFTNPLLTHRFLAMMLYRKDAATPRQVEILQEPQRRAGTTESYARWLPYLLFPERAAVSADPRNYARLRVPTALIWGRQDSVTPLPQGQQLNGLITGSSLDIIDDAGHIPHIEAPQKLVPLLVERLKGLSLIRGR